MRTSILAVLLASTLTCVAGLGRGAISDSDEAFYAEAAREMVESADYLTPRFNYATRFQKPVLYYWLAAAGYSVAGVSEAAARLPAALSGIGMALLAWWFGRRWYGDATGRIAGLAIATSIGAVVIARLALPDLPLALFISLTIAFGIIALLEGEELQPWWLIAAAVAAALGFLMKGPLSVVIPAIVLGPLVILERRWRTLRPAWFMAAAGVFGVVAAPWYVAMTAEHGYEYLHGFFIGDNLERFATDRFNAPRPVWFYLPIAIGGLLPWSPLLVIFLPQIFRLVRGRWRPDVRGVRLLVWWLLPLLLFTASVGKQPRYILPILPPLAIALAAALRQRGAGSQAPRDGWVTAGGTLSGAFVVLVGLLLGWIPAEPLAVPREALLAASAAALLSGGAVVWAAWRAQTWLALTLSVAGTAVLLGLNFAVISAPGGEAVQSVAVVVRPLAQRGIPWTTHVVFERNLVFYVGRQAEGPYEPGALVRRLQAGEPIVCVLDERDLAAIEGAARVPLMRLGRWEYFNMAAVRLRTLVDPGHRREFRTVVLVANPAAAALAR